MGKRGASEQNGARLIDPQMVASHRSLCISHILLRRSKASFKRKEKKAGKDGRADGREASGRRGRGSREWGEEAALMRPLPLSLRCCAARRQGGCAGGRSVEKEKKFGGKQDGREGEKGSAWEALQQLQLQQPVEEE